MAVHYDGSRGVIVGLRVVWEWVMGKGKRLGLCCGRKLDAHTEIQVNMLDSIENIFEVSRGKPCGARLKKRHDLSKICTCEGVNPVEASNNLLLPGGGNILIGLLEV